MTAERYASRHYDHFRETVGCVDLAEWYEIPGAHIVVSQKSACCFNLLWEYANPDAHPFSAVFEFELPPKYPFRPPKWTFDAQANSALPPELAIGFEGVVAEQNCQNDDAWSPALKFEKDILNLSVRVVALI